MTIATPLKHLGVMTGHVYEGADTGLLDRVPVPQAADSAHANALRVTIVGDEFTALCPATGGPDFGRIIVKYDPQHFLVESKSLKLYLESYRQERMFHEAAVQKICDDLCELLDPMWMRVKGVFKARGGWSIRPVAIRVHSQLVDEDGRATSVPSTTVGQ